MTTELDYTFISQLDIADHAVKDDLFLISKIEGNSEYKSYQLSYRQLCSDLMYDADDKIDRRISSWALDLSNAISINIDNIDFLSDTVDDVISAVVKIANCVQTNKSDIQTNKSNISALSNNISYLSDEIDVLRNATGENGIVITTKDRHIVIKHSNSIVPATLQKLYKFTYDSQGHISSSSSVTKDDITALGIPGQDTTYDLATTSTAGLVKLNSASNEELRKYGLSMETDGKAYVNVPWEKYGRASPDIFGFIKTGFAKDLENGQFPVQMNEDGNAYVEISKSDWQAKNNFETNTLTCNKYSTISSITQSEGNIVNIGENTLLYSTMCDLSAAAYNLNIPQLSTNYLKKDFVRLIVADPYIKLNYNDKTITSASIGTRLTDISSIHMMPNVDEGDERDGYYLRAKFNGDSIGDVGCSLPISCGETWTFTLDDGTTVDKQICIFRDPATAPSFDSNL